MSVQMNSFPLFHALPRALLALAMAFSLATPVRAHLMVEQNGTLNIVESDAFMVLSLPVSAFRGIDDNGDGAVSMIEFNRHREEIGAAVHAGVFMNDARGRLALHGLMLSPEHSHGAMSGHADASVSQIIVMGRFPLADASGKLYFNVDLFGSAPGEDSLKITATRPADSHRQVQHLTRANRRAEFFALDPIQD